ncbi:MAG: hypothetical protein ABS75_20700 [Pelagibacterium sp. SCN 63-23]|nr:MAG: hypothetical protein ABS75_20700 [Pelagibacterium sp. SCN 63-23]
MLLMNKSRRRLGAVATACLLSVALPAAPAWAQKVKNKTKPATGMETSVTVDIPTIDAVGSTIDEATIGDILRGNIAGHAQQLADLDATSIGVPEIVVSVTSQNADKSYDATITFSDLVFEGVVDGVAAGVSLGGIAMITEEGTFDFGTMTAADLNIGGMLGIYGLVDRGQTGLETIYTDFSSVGGTMQAEDVSCTIGAMNGAEFKARPLKTSFVEMMGMAQALEDDPDDLDPALLGQVIRMYADILTAFETTEVTFDGLSCEGTDDVDRPMTFSIAGMTMGGMSPGIYPAISMDGFDIVVEGDGAMSLDNFTMKQMDLSGLIATLESAPENVDERWLEANARALFPAIEGFSLSGFDMDIPDPDNDGARLKATIGNVDLTLARYLNGLPTSMDLSAANILAELPEDSGDETVEQLRALGITDIDAGFRVAAAWDEANSSINIEEMSFTGADLATVFLAGTIANATADLFALDTDTALAAGMSVAVKGLDLTVTDAGLSDIVLAVVAAEQGADPATLRPVFAGLAQGSVIAMMAGAADAAKLGEAINTFVSGKAKTLAIGIRAKQDPGLSLPDFIAAEEDPTTLLGKVNISAEAK